MCLRREVCMFIVMFGGFCFFFQAEDGIRDLQGDWSSDVCSSIWWPEIRAHVDSITRYAARATKAYAIRRSPRRCLASPVPDSSQITTVDAHISIRESRPNP